jgi:hypothetical protein
MNTDDPEMYELVDRSISHWYNFERADGWRDRCAFTLSSVASMRAATGRGDEALAMLHDLLGNLTHRSYVHVNTLSTEGGGRNPTFEATVAAANSIIELLLQSWGDTIRVFPAVPGDWQALSFADLRAQGGFLVSAERVDGRTAWVRIESLAGEPCRLRVPDWSGPLRIAGSDDFPLEVSEDGSYAIELERGQSITLYPKDQVEPASFTAKALPRAPAEANPYGAKPHNALSEDQSWPILSTRP